MVEHDRIDLLDLSPSNAPKVEAWFKLSLGDIPDLDIRNSEA